MNKKTILAGAAVIAYLGFAIPTRQQAGDQKMKQEIEKNINIANSKKVFSNKIEEFLKKIDKNELENTIDINGNKITLIKDFEIDYGEKVKALSIVSNEGDTFDLIQDKNGERFIKDYHIIGIEYQTLPHEEDYGTILSILKK